MAKAIEKMPSESLKDLAYTQDLKDFWQGLRDDSYNTALLFLYKSFNWDMSFYEENLSATEKKIHRILDASCERYLSMYKLINYTFSKLRKKLVACPTTAEYLFLSIVEWEKNAIFEHTINKDYYEVSPNEMKRFFSNAKKYVEYVENNSIPVRKLKHHQNTIPRYLKNIGSSPWYEILEKINTIHDSKVSFLGRNYNSAIRYLLESLEDVYESRNNDGTALLKTMIWNNGEVKYTGKN